MPRPPAWYDEQYNARAAIPDAPARLAAWARRSEQARASLRSVLDVPYSARGVGDASERLDLFLPAASSGPAPVLVHIHGGYWRALDKRDQSFVATPFVEAGALVVVPNYALCPQVTVAHIVMQIVQALAWVHDHAADHGGDPRRIVVTGHSAGGHLAAMTMACDWPAYRADLPPDLVAAAVPVSGLFDLEPLRHAPFLAPDLGLDAAEARRLSPARLPLLRPRTGSVLAFVGELESAEFHRQSHLLQRAWGRRVVARVEPVPGCHHLSVLDAVAEAGTRPHQALRQLLGI